MLTLFGISLAVLRAQETVMGAPPRLIEKATSDRSVREGLSRLLGRRQSAGRRHANKSAAPRSKRKPGYRDHLLGSGESLGVRPDAGCSEVALGETWHSEQVRLRRCGASAVTTPSEKAFVTKWRCSLAKRMASATLTNYRLRVKIPCS